MAFKAGILNGLKLQVISVLQLDWIYIESKLSSNYYNSSFSGISDLFISQTLGTNAVE